MIYSFKIKRCILAFKKRCINCLKIKAIFNKKIGQKY